VKSNLFSGLLERVGNVKAIKVTDTMAVNVVPHILQNVEKGSRLMTDEASAYTGVGKVYNHSVVNHGKREYVRGDIHTNSIGGFWSLFKHGVIGIYHHVSKEHFQKYLDEFTFHYNTCEKTESERFNHYLTNMCNCLKYQQLINHEQKNSA